MLFANNRWQRIQQIDLLRGSAVLAIFLLNISGFALPKLAYINPVYIAGTTAKRYRQLGIFEYICAGKFSGYYWSNTWHWVMGW